MIGIFSPAVGEARNAILLTWDSLVCLPTLPRRMNFPE